MSRVARFGVATALVAVGALCFAALGQGGGLFGGRLATAGLAGPSAGKASTVLGQRGDAASSRTTSRVAEDQQRYIVVFREPAVAAYRGGIGALAAPGHRTDKSGRSKLDAQGPAAVQYAAYLGERQAKHEARIAGLIGRNPAIGLRVKFALNGVVATLTATEAARIGRLPEVQLVEEYRELAMDTDTGPALIGAPALWNASTPGATGAYQGEGMVVGIIDSGINFESPSFLAVDPVDGYTHINPISGGAFLGTCAAGGADEGRCNTKLIGGYDFVCGAPGNQCGVAGVREEPGFGDTNGHGSHTASTAAGNRRVVEFVGNTVRISGVAPRANIIAYDVCYTNTTTGQGLCPNVSSVAAVEQMITDGIVDVANFSIGGGTQPWTDAVSLAFLNATNAGIYIASSAGNSGPTANTLGHVEPWVSATAASQHGRGSFTYLLQVTGPGTVPQPLTAIPVNPGTGGAVFGASIPPTTALKASPTFAGADDACQALPADTFAGAIALVRRGTCSFTIKANNAAAAGAIAVVIANNDTPGLIPSVPGTTVQVFGISGPDGVALAAFANANADTTVALPYPATRLPNVVDALGDFSSRGPAGTFDLLKPDVTAPGVQVLAAVSGTTSVTGSPNVVELYNGTSMASPHQAGAAALLRQARPGWTVAEVKSALMLTAKTGVLLEDQVSPANPFARGAGRIRVDRAVNTGLVMDETGANYLAANPASGGDPKTLNQPSYGNRNCAVSCTFTRVFRNPTARSQTYFVRLSGVRGSATPRLAKLAPGQTVTVQVVLDTSAQPTDGVWRFGSLDLQQTGLKGGTAQVMSLPIAVTAQPPAIALPAQVNASHEAGANGSFALAVGNTGAGALNYTAGVTGTASLALVSTARGAVGSGFRGTRYTDPATAGNAAQFSADDFTLQSATTLTSLASEGFIVSGVAFNTAALDVNWSIYPDLNGLPAGNPQSAAGAAVWSYTASPTSAGVTTTGGVVTLNLAAAGQAVQLPAGKYWLVISTRGIFANRWAQFGSADGAGGFVGINVATNGAGTWTVNTAFASLNLRIRGLVDCGATWLGAATPATGMVAGGGSQVVNVGILGAGLTAGERSAFVCVASNDPAIPRAASRVTLTTTAAP